MYFLNEQRYDTDNMQTTIIRKYKSVEKAKQKKLEMEKLDSQNGYLCNYFITKLISND
jgi:hypothetical protein